MKLVIFGGRTFNNSELMADVLTELNSRGIIPDDVELVCGMARGADITAYKLFKNTCNKVHEYPADWDGLGKRAGYARNTEMAKFAEMGLAFWDLKSKGTKHMIDTMDRLGKTCYVVRY